MKRNIFSLVLMLGIFAIANSAFAATIYVDASATGANNGTSPTDAFTTIQAAINDAGTHDGDTINIADGTYIITTTIEVSKSLTLQGTSQAGTILNGTSATGAFGPFVIHSSKSNITFNDFTLTSHAGGGGRGFKIEGTTTNTSGAAQDGVRSSNVSINRVTVNGDGGTASRTGIDINGVNGVNLTDVTSQNNGGNGISFSDCGNITMTNVTTSGNKWGGVALYTKGQYYPGGISSVTISNLNASESNPLYNQNEGTFNSGGPFTTTGLSAPQFTYSATNNLNSDSSTYVWYNTDPNNLGAYVIAVTDAAHTKVKDSSGNTIVVTGQTIQSQIDAATAGDIILVPAGNFTENLTINKSLVIHGNNANVDPVTDTRYAETVLTGSVLITSGGVKFDGFTITNPTYSGPSIKGIQIYSSGPTISTVTLTDNIISNINNANTKGAYGIMVQGDVSNINIAGNKINSISSAGWARGIEVTAGCNVANVPASVTINGNSISNITVTSGTDVYNLTVDWCDSPVKIADASQITLENNIFDKVSVRNLDTTHPLLITKNWWGVINPDFTTASGTVTYNPWCTISNCTTLYTPPQSPVGAADWASKPSGGSIVTPTSTTTIVTSTSTASTTTVIVPLTSSSTPQVLGVTKFNFTKNLGYGSLGDDVSELQKILIAQKYLILKTGLPTGWFGPLTRAALAKWQVANSIKPADGYFGPISREKMNQ